MRVARIPACLLAAALSLTGTAGAQKGDWIGTWTAAAVPTPVPATLPLGKQDVTVRQVVHISQGGKRVRITFTNEFGAEPLHIAAAHVAFLSVGSTILTETDKGLTFGGKADVTIAPGQFAASDALVERVPSFSDLVITTVIPQQPMSRITVHSLGLTTTFFQPGAPVDAKQFDSPGSVPPGITPPDVSAPIRSVAQGQSPAQEPIVKAQHTGPTTSATSMDGAVTKATSWYFLKDVEVNREKKSAAVVTLGDSITDGARSTPETNRRWPDVMAALFTVPGPLLGKTPPTLAFTVLNAGISGNRILHEGAGPSALDRFDRDVIRQPGARYVILLEGINDIGNMNRAPADAITEQQLIDACTTMANRAHAAGLKFIAATVLPYNGAKYYSEDGEQIRQHLNAFLRTSPLMDGVIDFDKITSDPANPGHMLPKYDSGDHLHPSDAGYAAMGAAVDLKLFAKKKK